MTKCPNCRSQAVIHLKAKKYYPYGKNSRPDYVVESKEIFCFNKRCMHYDQKEHDKRRHN